MLTQPQPLPTAQPDNDSTQKNRQRGTGFTNINRILGANQGAGQKMGQAIGGNLTNQAGQVNQGLQQGQSQFQAGAQQGLATANNNIKQGQDLQQQKIDPTTGQPETNEAYTNRLASMNGDQLAQQGQTVKNTAYTGPKGLNNASQIESQAANIGALGKLAGSTAGQSQLLRSQVANRGNYSQGQNSFDQLLLGREGQNAIQQGRQATNGLNQNVQNGVLSAQNQAAANDAAINTNRINTLQNLNNQLSGTGDSTTGNTTGFITQAKNQAKQYNDQGVKLQQMLQGKNPDGTTIDASHPSKYTDDDIALLDKIQQYGLNPDQMVYGKNMGDYGNTLSGLTSNIDTSQTNGRFQGNQANAAQNLASFLGDDATKNQIASNKFNDALFNPVQQQEEMARNADLYQSDLANQGKIQGSANDMARIQADLWNNRNYDGNTQMAQANAAARGQLQNEFGAGALQNYVQNGNAGIGGMVEGLRDQAKNAVGTQKSLRQLALERLGKEYVTPTQTDVGPSSTKKQV